MTEIGDKVELVFSTAHVERLHPGVRGKVTELDGGVISGVLWDDGTEMEFIMDAAVDTLRIVSRIFVTKAQKQGRVIMQFLGDDAVLPLPPPKRGRRVKFLFSAARFGNKYLHEGIRGTVLGVDDLGTIAVRWDNGAAFGLVPDWDHFKILPKEKEQSETRRDSI